MLDLDPEHGFGRFAERDRIEGESPEFHGRVRAAFLDMAAADPDHYLVLDARRPADEIAAAVWRAGRAPARAGGAAMTTATAPTVWDSLVGQRRAIEALRTAASGHGMSQAFLFIGPPGSGRSNAAIAFAAALQCEEQPPGCGVCHSCHTVLAGSHADVTVVRTEKLSIGVDEVRDLVRRSALAPVGRRWQIMIVEDADRLTDQAGQRAAQGDRGAHRPHGLDALRADRRGPPADDPVALPAGHADHAVHRRGGRLPGPQPTASTPRLASYCARASQGHIGRARALARDEGARNRRHEVISWPARLTSLGACMNAATNLARDHAGGGRRRSPATSTPASGPTSTRRTAWWSAGAGRASTRRPSPRWRRSQKTRAKRRHLDVVDRSLMDLGLGLPRRDRARHRAAASWSTRRSARDIEQIVRTSTPELNLRRIGWIFDAREQMLEFNVPVAARARVDDGALS